MIDWLKSLDSWFEWISAGLLLCLVAMTVLWVALYLIEGRR